MKRSLMVVLVLIFAWGADHSSYAGAQQVPEVTEPPEEFFEKVRQRHRDAARQFYRKYIDIDGIPVAAAAEVADAALRETHDIVSHMLAARPDIVRAMVDRNMYLIIIGKDQLYTDMPEYRDRPNPDYLNERVRGTGGIPTSFGEENLIGWPLDRYDDESIAVHEFCHTIDNALRSIDPEWRERRNRTYENAMEKGLYRLAYAAGNPGEYWAEIAQSYFDCNRVNNWNHGPIGTREQLKAYDPEGYELVRSVFRLSPDQDWRYQPPRKRPFVGPPPEPMGIHPYYTRFIWAREFVVLGREARDEALLRADDVIRKMFAYRHDILKAFIAEDLRLVVLGENESLGDLPELRDLSGDAVDLTVRVLPYAPGQKLLAVGEEDLLGTGPDAGSSRLMDVLARAIHGVTGTRPVDPAWEDRPRREWQQYELRVQRLDERFDRALRSAFATARENGLWQNTTAIHDHVRYWAQGVLAYFDAVGQEPPPLDRTHPVTTREALREYDTALYDLVHQTMAYAGRVDWRYPY